MPQLSEKRSPPHAKENNTKENISNLNGKGLEILDFRESWLQEIEVYKDQVRAQQLLTTHNNLNTVEGCLKDESKLKDMTIKKRVRTRSDSEQQQQSSDKVKGHKELEHERPREDNTVVTKANDSQSNGIVPHHNNHSRSQTNPNHIAKTTTGQSGTNTNAATTNGHKIIINNYHASSLLNPNQLEAKIKNASSSYSPTAPNQINSSAITKSVSKSKGDESPVGVNKVTNSLVEENLVSAGDGPVNGRNRDGIVVTPPDDAVVSPISNAANNLPNDHGKSDDDVGSNLDDDDDDDFGDIDNIEIFDDSSDESDNEYRGCTFALKSDEMKEHPSDVDVQNEISNAQYTTAKSILTPSLFPNVPPYLTFSSHSEKGPYLPPELQKILKWKLSPVMPKIVKKVVINSGFRLIKKTTDWMAVWEKHMKSPCFKTIRSHQKFNHLPGSFKIGRKDSVWRNIRGLQQKFGKSEFGFMQKTFILPQELDMLKRAWPKYAKKSTKWIVKPPASARGTGISVVNKWSDFPKQKPLIVQKYIERPLLINESKFDMRLYVIVTSINPLRIYMNKDGLARFASVQYSNNLDTLSDRCMHLTNYSVNKLSANYAKNEDINACQGHKWTLKSLWTYFRKRGINTNRLWGTIRDLVIKTVIGGESGLNRMFRQNVNSRYNCYELFGFDVLLDENLVPWLLEVNISPSLHSDLPLDMHIKGPLIQAVLNAALYQVPPKLNETQKANILQEMDLKGPLCYDRRMYTTCLSPEEIKKHNHFTSEEIEFREEYLDTILDNLTPDDVRCLILHEDELARSSPLERIFPTADSHKYLKFLEGARYYNCLIDAWETKYADRRQDGIKLIQNLCNAGVHLQVPSSALIEEPFVEFTDVDLLHVNLNKPADDSAATDAQKPKLIQPDGGSGDQLQICSKQANDDQKIKEFLNNTRTHRTVDYVK